MKPQELMIGDWYANSDNDYCKVIRNFGKEVWGEGNDVSDSTDAPRSIPLTPKILQANGFKGNKLHSVMLMMDTLLDFMSATSKEQPSKRRLIQPFMTIISMNLLKHTQMNLRLGLN